MTRATKGVTRRRFLEGIGLAGGSAALYETMTAMGLINIPEAWAGPPQLPPGSGVGKKVVILGAGIAGLTAAYELRNAGYHCQIIELTERAGGRNHTARRGTVLVENLVHAANGLKQRRLPNWSHRIRPSRLRGRISPMRVAVGPIGIPAATTMQKLTGDC